MELSSLLPIGRGLLVTSPSFVKRGIANLFVEHAQGRLVDIFYDVPPNPTISSCQNAINLAKSQKVDFILALGGGSVIDLSKLVAVGILSNKHVQDWFDGEPLPQTGVTLIAMPTTAGTGSEVTSVAVLSSDTGGIKKPLSTPAFQPQFAYIDPTLTLSVPPYITACTGFDAIAHALEAYWSKHHQPICDALAIQALKKAFSYLPIAYHEPKNLKARTEMAEASLLAGLAFSLPKTAAAHALSYPLTHHHHIPHGEACALSLDFWLRFNAQDDEKRYLDLAQQLGFQNVLDLADFLYQLKKDLGLRTNLKDIGLSDKEKERIIREAQNKTLENNPRAVEGEVLQDWLDKMLC